ncbi:MAG: hypothetical protein HUU15_08895 [Candidatus Brocadiae bacterium]|nr:hypothetical protein [Candidatus Brocadiia bacterium]
MTVSVTGPATKRRPIGLRLTVSFLAFLAVVPLLIYVAGQTSLEGGEREREREWLLRRTNASIGVSTWFDRKLRSAQLAQAETFVVGEDTELDAGVLQAELQGEFPGVVKALDLQSAALFVDTSKTASPALRLLSRVGAVDPAPDSELTAAARSRVPVASLLTPGDMHALILMQVSLPLEAGEHRFVARLVFPATDRTTRPLAHATALSRWALDVRERLLRVREKAAAAESANAMAAALRKAQDQPVKDWEPLRKQLQEEIESVTVAHSLRGLTIFLAVRAESGEGRVLRPWLRSGESSQEWGPTDAQAFATGQVPVPADGRTSTVSLPLLGRVPAATVEGVEPGVVAVARFELPPPPPRATSARAFLIVMIGIMALVLGSLFFYIQQAVSQPIQRLIGAMTRGKAGDLEPIAQGGASGEVAQLALIYNSMVQENRTLLDQIRGFNEQLKKKVQLATGELERRNDELRRANDRLFGIQRELSEQQRLASLGQLAGSMAHELGTPLNAMSGHIELLLTDEAGLPADVSKRLKLIGGQIERLSGIIQKTLHQLRAPAPRFVSVDLNALAQGIVSLVTPSVTARKVAIRMSLSTGLPRVSGDPGQLEQVLMNLVNNALDAMPGGGSLDLLTTHQDGQVCLQVRDSGAGVPDGDIQKIFDPFFTTKSPGKGTGLGLAICREIVKAHHGSVDVQSSPGRGTWFTVKFPPEVSVENGGEAAPMPVAR